jgi:hypothetical protein
MFVERFPFELIYTEFERGVKSMITKISKRDGREVPFSIEKISMHFQGNQSGRREN